MRYFAFILILTSKICYSLETATFAGGCFWCVEADLEKIEGVKSVISGYAGGRIEKPSYEQVARGQTKHLESVQVTFDPNIISYPKLLISFWKVIDPTDAGGQFVDRGHQYSSAIFYQGEKQRDLALRSRDYIVRNKFFKKEVLTPIVKFTNFYPAEDYHQDFYKKNPKSIARYKSYRAGSGRDQFIKKYWKGVNLDFLNNEFSKPQDSKIKKMLSQLEYNVTQKDATERPFKNKYWDNKAEGIYVDIVSGEPLFSSRAKFKSGTGWPSFTSPILKDAIIEKEDNSLLGKRIEVRSKYGDSHLGHVFNDGPKPTNLRYCINSASLKFIKKSEMAKKGYSFLSILFK